MTRDETLMTRALERLQSLQKTCQLVGELPAANANGLRYIIEDLEERLSKWDCKAPAEESHSLSSLFMSKGRD